MKGRQDAYSCFPVGRLGKNVDGAHNTDPVLKDRKKKYKNILSFILSRQTFTVGT